MKIYLAGPDVFRENAVEHGEMLKAKCKALGFEGLYPLDNEIHNYQDDPRQMSYEIYQGNMELIKECDVIVANLDPFRGPSVDCGTAFEIGAGVALGKRVIGYFDGGSIGSYYKDRVLPVFDVFSKQYSQVEDFELTDNLMIHWGCEVIFSSFDMALEELAEM